MKTESLRHRAAILFFALGLIQFSAAAGTSIPRTFHPGQIWNDITGNPINAHGGGLLVHDGVYYWYGEFKEGKTWSPESNRSWGGTRVIARGVSCYSSTNLYDWKFEGLALPAVTNDTTSDLHSSKVIERPKVIFNRATKKFVMWLHIDSEDYKAARSGVAVSDLPTGPFIYIGSFRPNAGVWPENATASDKAAGPTNYLARDFAVGQMARDMTLFVDDDGKAYQFYASEENATMHVSLLSDDYLKPAGRFARIFIGRSMEAPAVFKRNGKYYLMASDCTGWAPNAARSAVADSIFGPWKELGNPCVGRDADKTFTSQSAFIVPVAGSEQLIFAADRWEQWNLPDSRYIWLPIEFSADGKPQLHWQKSWSLAERRPPIRTTSTSKQTKHAFAIGTNDFLLDGQRFQIRCGEVHAPRVPPEYWRHRLQMAKAMGLNTVCAYLFWNMHEPRPGEFNWSGEADAAEFCRIAQEEGLWVILRPGPYACAEWEMGGFPSWLLKYDDIKLRTRDPRFIAAAKSYFKEVGRVLGAQQITRGGPILMVQVENEYGFYGKDAEYMGELRQALLDSGFDVPLFACNPPYALKNGYRAELFPVVNFGADPIGGFKALREILPQGPLMCGEFYPGWFDTWGAPHHLGKTQQYLTDLEYMLKSGASFSIYMAHGGTTFGFWTGADRPFKPDTSSYDYDAPITEAGWTTDKFFKTRELFAKYLLPGELIPEPPAKNALINFGPVEAQEFAPLFRNLPTGQADAAFRNLEYYDQSFGCILYSLTLPAGPAATLEAAQVHDIGQVFLGTERIGFMDRRSGNFKARLPERKTETTLNLLVEAMGRVNFGVEVHDRKGLQGPVTLTSAGGASVQLTNQWVRNLPLDDHMLAKLRYETWAQQKRRGTNAFAGSEPAFWHAKVKLKETGDCFLDLRPYTKGFAWVNGHNLGRFWNIGPQQTMFIPGPWLQPGENEIVVLDLIGPRTNRPIIAASAQPILNELHPEFDFARKQRPANPPALDFSKPTHSGSFAAGAEAQEIRFASPAKGRFFAIESLSAQDGQPFAAIAEIVLLDEAGKNLNTEGWSIAYVDSEEQAKEDGAAENAIDGQTANYWHTEWSDTKPSHPHRLILNLGQVQTVSGFRYVPRQGTGGGRIKDYRVFVGDAS